MSNNCMWNPEITEEVNDEFIEACESGDLLKIKKLLRATKNRPKAEINYNNNQGFVLACGCGHLEVVRYLLEEKNKKEEIKLHDYDDAAFKVAADYSNMNILQYFIFDRKIEKTEEIKKHLEKLNKHEIENLFTLRELNANLENDLQNNQISIRKNKI